MMDLAAQSSSRPFYIAGGTLPPDAASYVTRRADIELLEGLQQGHFCYILTSRQMGKSSLMVRTAERLQQEGSTIVFLDLQALGQNLTPDQWYDGLLARLSEPLGLEDELDDFWLDHPHLGPMQRFFTALVQVALPRVEKQLVIFVDEIDIVRTLHFSADEFFVGIRQCFVGRATEPELARLTFCLLGSVMPSELVRDTRITPFNIGRRIELTDFTRHEAAPLAEGLGRDIQTGTRLLDRILYWTNGHPYLTQCLCLAVLADPDVQRASDIDLLCSELFLSASARTQDNNLLFVRERMLRSRADITSLMDLYKRVRAGKRLKDDETNPLPGVLKLSGIVRVEGGLLKVRNRIYEHVFDRDWVQAQLPDAEKRRQKAAFRRGLTLAGSLAGVIIALLTGLVVWAVHSARIANGKTEEADRNLYVANMRLLQSSWEMNNFERFRELLAQTQARGRGTFEWGYWHRLSHLDMLTLRGHTESVPAAAYSPDGSRILTGSLDKTAKVWDAVTGRELMTLRGHSEGIHAVDYSPDGTRILTGSNDTTARVWNAATGTEIMRLTGHSNGVWAVAFSPDGTRILTGSADETARVWDATNGQKLLILKGRTGPLLSVAYSPNGRRILTGSWDGIARVWDAATGKEIMRLRGHTSFIPSAVFSRDGRYILTASNDRTARVWNAVTGKVLRILKHSDVVGSAAFSPDGKRILTGNDDRIARVWDAVTGKVIMRLRGHSDYLGRVSFSPDGTRILTGSLDNTAKVWDATKEQEQLILKSPAAPILATVFSSAVFSRDGRYVLTGGWDNAARVWDAVTGRELMTLRGHTAYVTFVAYSPDGKRILTGSDDRTARVWDAVKGREKLLILKENARAVHAVAYSRDGTRILTGYGDGAVSVWDAKTGKGDRCASVWDAATGKELMTLRGHAASVNAVAFSPDGKRILTGHGSRIASVWDAKTGKELMKLRGHTEDVSGVAFSPDGTRILTGSVDRTARVWDVANGQELLILKGHTGPVWAVAFSPNGRRILTGCDDGTARVWDVDDTPLSATP